MNTPLRYALQGTAAVGSGLAASALQKGAVKEYQKRGMSETGSAFAQPGFENVIQQYEKQTGLSPEVTANFQPSGVSYSRIGRNSISLNVDKASQFTLGHELGHQAIEAGGGPLQWIQRHTYGGVNPNVLGLANIAIGATSPSMRRATTLALGLNYLNNSGRIVSEIEASRRGTDLLHAAGYPVSYGPALFQTAGYAVAPAATTLAGVGAGRFLRSFASKLV